MRIAVHFFSFRCNCQLWKLFFSLCIYTWILRRVKFMVTVIRHTLVLYRPHRMSSSSLLLQHYQRLLLLQVTWLSLVYRLKSPQERERSVCHYQQYKQKTVVCMLVSIWISVNNIIVSFLIFQRLVNMWMYIYCTSSSHIDIFARQYFSAVK
jgi:hypothetical protein